MSLSLDFYLGVIHNIAKVVVPGFAFLIPISSLLKISNAVRASLGHDIDVDWKFSDIAGLRKALFELAEVAINKTEKEILEAIYYLLCYITTLENYLTLDQFMASANDTIAAVEKENPGMRGAVVLFPSSNIAPDGTQALQEDNNTCKEPVLLPS